ncbi:hypothetical protein PENPOL_c007G05265 [Penicillium polonicum]|uniref:Uncharacterized protein n=1 Tax=Penicillium polonicum TaxID=60169 RepID=A0A1V6NJJ5_PENPO|nr:hypothetical protein PENPOL_c007G05265 [Penicillium polonicum]
MGTTHDIDIIPAPRPSLEPPNGGAWFWTNPNTTTAITAIMGSILDLNNARENLEHDVERLPESQTFLCIRLNRVVNPPAVPPNPPFQAQYKPAATSKYHEKYQEGTATNSPSPSSQVWEMAHTSRGSLEESQPKAARPRHVEANLKECSQ